MQRTVYAMTCCQVSKDFDFGMVERIRAQFDVVNVSQTGTLSPEQFDMFLVAVGAISAREDARQVSHWCGSNGMGFLCPIVLLLCCSIVLLLTCVVLCCDMSYIACCVIFCSLMLCVAGYGNKAYVQKYSALLTINPTKQVCILCHCSIGFANIIS